MNKRIREKKMGEYTTNLNLFKYDVIKDADVPFSITKALNENWDKIDRIAENGLPSDGVLPVTNTVTESSAANQIILDEKDVNGIIDVGEPTIEQATKAIAQVELVNDCYIDREFNLGNFNGTNYALMNKDFDVTNATSWEIVVGIKIPDAITSNQYIYTSKITGTWSVALYINSSRRVVFQCSSNGTSFNISSGWTSTEVVGEFGDSVLIKVSYDGTAYKILKSKISSVPSWTEIYTTNNSNKISNISTLYFNTIENASYVFKGEILLKHCYFSVNGARKWTGVEYNQYNCIISNFSKNDYVYSPYNFADKKSYRIYFPEFELNSIGEKQCIFSTPNGLHGLFINETGKLVMKINGEEIESAEEIKINTKYKFALYVYYKENSYNYILYNVFDGDKDFENMVFHGDLTIENGTASNFSAKNFIEVPAPSEEINSFRIECEFTLPQTISATQSVYGQKTTDKTSPQIQIKTGDSKVLEFSTPTPTADGSGGEWTSTSISVPYKLGATYKSIYEYKNKKLKVSIKEETSERWQEYGDLSLPSVFWSEPLCFGKDTNTIFGGKIDLESIKIYVNDKLYTGNKKIEIAKKDNVNNLIFLRQSMIFGKDTGDDAEALDGKLNFSPFDVYEIIDGTHNNAMFEVILEKLWGLSFITKRVAVKVNGTWTGLVPNGLDEKLKLVNEKKTATVNVEAVCEWTKEAYSDLNELNMYQYPDAVDNVKRIFINTENNTVEIDNYRYGDEDKRFRGIWLNRAENKMYKQIEGIENQEFKGYKIGEIREVYNNE